MNCGKTCACDHENMLCSPVNGRCSCASGFTGSKCDRKCPDGLWGRNCQEKCMCPGCDAVTGQCKKCPPGRIGPDCEQRCPSNWWGDNCEQVCTLSANEVMVYNLLKI